MSTDTSTLIGAIVLGILLVGSILGHLKALLDGSHPLLHL